MPYRRRLVRKPRKRIAKKRSARKSSRRDAYKFKLQAQPGVLGVQSVPASSPPAPFCSAPWVNVQTGPAGNDGNIGTYFTGNMAFSLSNAIGSSQIVGLFDRYKIKGVRIRLIPMYTQAITGGQFAGINVSSNLYTGANAVIPTMRVVWDYDDSGIPTIGDVFARPKGKTFMLNKQRSFYLSPKQLLAMASTGSSTSALVPGRMVSAGFINCSYPSVTHLGLKFAVRNWPLPTSSGAPSFSVRVVAEMYVQTREQITPNAIISELASLDLSGNYVDYSGNDNWDLGTTELSGGTGPTGPTGPSPKE